MTEPEVQTDGELSGLLGSTETTVVDPGQTVDPGVWHLQRYLQRNSQLPGTRKCLKVRRESTVLVELRESGSVTFAGYCRCHSIWACPSCAPAIRFGRARELSTALIGVLGSGERGPKAEASGAGALMDSMTIPHGMGDALGEILPKVHKAWYRLGKAKMVRDFRGDHGIEWTRSTEIPYGSNGFHPHIHALSVSPLALTDRQLCEWYHVLDEEWRSAALSVGLGRPSEANGVKTARASVDVAAYMEKGVVGAASELLRADTKAGRGTVSMFTVLKWAADGDVAAGRVFGEYERVTKGRRALGRSKGFAELCPVVERSEDELLEDRESWDPVVASVELPGELASLLWLIPEGYEVATKAVQAGTEAAAVRKLLWGRVPWWVTEAGWSGKAQRDREEAAADVEAARVLADGVQGSWSL